MRESKVERHLHQRVLVRGGMTYKFVSPGRRGVPDRIVIWSRGDIHFVECKAPGKKPTAGQAREHKRLRDLGCTVLVLDSVTEVNRYVNWVYGR